MISTHGQPFMDADGIEVEIKQDTHRAIFPYPQYVVSFRLQPTARGMQSRAYQTLRAEYHDDWSTSLSDPEHMVDAFRSAGIPDDETEAILNAAHQLRQTQPLI